MTSIRSPLSGSFHSPPTRFLQAIFVSGSSINFMVRCPSRNGEARSLPWPWNEIQGLHRSRELESPPMPAGAGADGRSGAELGGTGIHELHADSGVAEQLIQHDVIERFPVELREHLLVVGRIRVAGLRQPTRRR